MFHRLLLIVAVASVCTTPVPAQAPKPKPDPNLPTEPMATSFSLEKSVEFLDRASVTWTQQRKCGSCHTNYAHLMARPAVRGKESPAAGEIRKFFENRVANWDTAKPRWDTEVVATAVALAFNDAKTTGKLHPMTRAALDRMWKLQQPSGAWSWLKCNWPPMEHDDYFGAVYAAVGVGIAPDGYAGSENAREGVAKLKRYLRETPAPDLHHRAMLLWASMHLDGLLTNEQREGIVKKLMALQRADGGWSLPSLGNYQRHNGQMNDAKEAPSDGYGTGFVLYVLRQAGVPAEHEQLRRGVQWLKANQRASGRWFTRSLSTDMHHFITHAGTAYAIMALAACGE